MTYHDNIYRQLAAIKDKHRAAKAAYKEYQRLAREIDKDFDKLYQLIENNNVLIKEMEADRGAWDDVMGEFADGTDWDSSGALDIILCEHERYDEAAQRYSAWQD